MLFIVPETVSSWIQLKTLSPTVVMDDGREIEVKEKHPENNLLLIIVIEERIVIEDKDVHPSNADSPIDVTDEGTNISVNDLQSLKAKLPIEVTEEGIEIDFNKLHPLNALSLIDITDGGSMIVVKDEQIENIFSGICWSVPIISRFVTPSKASSPIISNEEGIDIKANELHPLNAFFPIYANDGGSIIVFRYVHSSNALSSIEVVGETIVIFSIDEFL